MRIGILTFHNAQNYGAVLQAYASVRFLQSLGHQVYVVDYRNRSIESYFNPFYWERARSKKEGLKYAVKYPFIVWAKIRRSLVFNRFVHQRLPLCSLSEANNLDLLLVGSDQLWNKKLTSGVRDAVYFGNAFPKVRKVTWGVSAGNTIPDADEIQMLRKNFVAFSIREQCLADMIPHSILLPDPTLMLDAGEWKRLVRPVNGNKYVLAYPMAYEEEVVESARQKAGEMGFDLKVILPIIKLGSSWIQTASPEEFLSLFYSAEYVVTSAYHGAVFSLLFERPHTFIHHGDPRFDTLLSSGLSSAAVRAKQFLDGIIPPPSSGGESSSEVAW